MSDFWNNLKDRMDKIAKRNMWVAKGTRQRERHQIRKAQSAW